MMRQRYGKNGNGGKRERTNCYPILFLNTETQRTQSFTG